MTQGVALRYIISPLRGWRGAGCCFAPYYYAPCGIDMMGGEYVEEGVALYNILLCLYEICGNHYNPPMDWESAGNLGLSIRGRRPQII